MDNFNLFINTFIITRAENLKYMTEMGFIMKALLANIGNIGCALSITPEAVINAVALFHNIV